MAVYDDGVGWPILRLFGAHVLPSFSLQHSLFYAPYYFIPLGRSNIGGRVEREAVSRERSCRW